jgi:hypothetical protein
LLAYRLLDFGQFRQGLSDARGGLEVFKQKIFDAYREPWENLKDKPGFERLAAEHASLQRDLAVAQRADQLYASDIPISRGALSLLSELASSCARFVNRNRASLKAAEPVKLSKSDTAEALRAALQDLEEKIEAAEYAYPTFDEAWSMVAEELDSLARLPSVSVHNRETPPQAPRELPVKMIASLNIPTTESTHPTAPGSRLFLVQKDATGLIFGLFRPKIEELLKGQLEKLYADTKPLILSAAERSKQLKAAKAERLTIERKLSQLFWNGASATILHREISPAAVLGVEA